MSILGIDVGDLSSQTRPVDGIGSLNADQLGTVLAQKSKTVASQNSLTIDEVASRINVGTDLTTSGVGKYATNVYSLENSGFLKPGTVERFIDNPSQLESVLSSTSVWTGKEGIESVNNVLGNQNLQSVIQNNVLTDSFNGLTSSGILSGSESPDVVAGVTSVAADFGVSGVSDWLSGASNPIDSVNMDNIARGGQYSVNFVDTKLTSMFSAGENLIGGAVGAAGEVVTNLIGDVGGAIGSLTDNLNLGSLTDNLNLGGLNELVGSIGGISSISDAAGNLLGGLTGSVSGLLGGFLGGFSSLFGGGSGPRTITPPAVTQTVNRSGIDAAVTAIIGNAKVPTPNYTGIVTSNAFQLPSLSGLVSNPTSSSASSVTVCSCSDPTIIGATQSECEAAGGTWLCTTVNNTITRLV